MQTSVYVDPDTIVLFCCVGIEKNKISCTAKGVPSTSHINICLHTGH